MTDFIIKPLPYDLSNQAGLALIGKYLKRINFNALVDSALSFRSGIANSDLYLLRLVDQHTLHEHDAPVRHSAQGYTQSTELKLAKSVSP